MSKKGKMDYGLILTLAVVALVALEFGIVKPQAGAGDGAGAGGDTKITIDSGCSGISGATMTLNINDKYTKTTKRSGEFTRVFLDGVDMEYKAAGGTLSVGPGQAYVLYGSENSSATSGYYTVKKAGVMPCKDEPIQFFVAPTGAPTFTYWDLNDAANTAVDLAADQTKVIKYRWTAPSKNAFGNPSISGAKNVQCFTYNTSVINKVTALDESPVSQPKGANTYTSAHTGYSADCYTMPVIENNGEYIGRVEVETASTAPALGTHGLNVSISDVDYDLNADDASEIIGVEDEDKNDLGRADVVGNILLQ